MTGKPTFQEIKARVEGEQANIDIHVSCQSQEHLDMQALIEMVEAQTDLAHPHHATRGSSPLVVYFDNEQDRQGFINAVKEAVPGMRTVKLP